MIWARGCLMVGLCAFGGIVASDEPPKDGGCGWSEAWHELHARFTKFPPGAKLTDSKRTKGAIDRPHSAVPRTVQGTWLVEAVIDEKGKVRDAKIVTTPRIEPPWPEYEEAVLKSIRKWKYTPVLVDGTPWPNCTTITIRDK